MFYFLISSLKKEETDSLFIFLSLRFLSGYVDTNVLNYIMKLSSSANNRILFMSITKNIFLLYQII